MGGDLGRLKPIFEKQTGNIKVCGKLSEDGIKLYVDVLQIPGAESLKIDAAGLMYLLKDVVPTGLKEPVLTSIAAALGKGEQVKDRLIATGTPPVSGVDGALELFVKKITETLGGSGVQYVREIENVEPGMIIGRISPPGDGQPGVSALGVPVQPKPGKPFAFKGDSTLKLRTVGGSERVQYVIAGQSGFLHEDRGRLHIVKELSLGGEIDVSCGNISFAGKVAAAKSIAKGLSISGRTGVQVGEQVYGGSLESTGGAILVSGFVGGGRGYRVRAAGEFRAHSVQHVDALVDGDVVIQKDSIESTLCTFGRLLMTQGHVVNGKVMALLGVEVDVLGSAGGSQITVAGFSDKEVAELLEKTAGEVAELEKNEKTLLGAAAPFLAEENSLPALGLAQIKKINQLLAALEQTRVSLRNLAARLERLRRSGEVCFQVNYKHTLHKGVRLVIGDHIFIADVDISGPGTIEFNRESGEFRVVRAKPLPDVKPPQPRPSTEGKK